MKNFALKLLDWHGGMASGLYSVGSCMLAGDARWHEQVRRACAELRDDASQPCYDAAEKAEAAGLATALEIYDKLDAFVRACLTAALWAETDGTEPLDDQFTLADFAPATLKRIADDCDTFKLAAWPILLPLADSLPNDWQERAGHDFWLTRNGHGAGFWDGDWPKTVSGKLTALCKQAGQLDLHVGDDRKIHV